MWTEAHHWLPYGVTWDNLEKFSNSSTTQSTPHIGDFFQVIPFTIILTALRFTFERSIRNQFTKGSTVGEDDRRKVGECAWLAVYFASITAFSTYSLLNVEWRQNYQLLWADYPFQFVDENVRLLYMVELGRYMSLMITLGTDRKRTDFAQVVTHHIATIALLSLSYMSNFTRFGAVILWYHNISDIFLQIAKAAKVTSYKKTAEVTFVTFSITFWISRLYCYPRLVWEGVIKAAPFKPFTVYNIVVGFLCLLELLHIMWSYTIAVILFKSLRDGEVTDIREEKKHQE